jgi:hypothetical protein
MMRIGKQREPMKRNEPPVSYRRDNPPFSGKPHAIRMGNEVLEGVVQVIREKKISGRAL